MVACLSSLSAVFCKIKHRPQIINIILSRAVCTTICQRTIQQIAVPEINARKMASGRLSVNDPNSFSNPESAKSTHIKLKWEVDFNRKAVIGTVTHQIERASDSASKLILDTRQLKIKAVRDALSNEELKFDIGADEIGPFGRPLTVDLGPETSEVAIDYETTSGCTALQWLEKEQTKGKRHPYMFSQCQAIHARSLLPCQDTPFVKASYEAEVTTPQNLQALMSAIPQGKDSQVFKFRQSIPIQSYLIALAVGDIKGKKIGPRTTVWTEPELLEECAKEFEDTERFIQIGEKIMGEYVWGIYDILVLPPSFPYGGMENPCLTFATPTLLAGDKSLVNVIAHEISHSWTGNLVTNKNFEHFWLNEGFTVYAERLILKEMLGEETRQFCYIGGWKVLSDCIKALSGSPQLTKLVVDLTNTDPDDAFSSVPYEKGSCLLYYLETLVGFEKFTAFFRNYIDKFKYKSIETRDFVAYFESCFPGVKVDWNGWFYSEGMPLCEPSYDKTLSKMCNELADKWMNTEGPFDKKDLDEFSIHQKIEFLSILIDDGAEKLNRDKIVMMEKLYDFGSSGNCEILFRWHRLATRYSINLLDALKFLTTNGRMKYVRPLYRELYNNTNCRDEAIAHFKKTKDAYFPICANLLAKDLKIE